MDSPSHVAISIRDEAAPRTEATTPKVEAEHNMSCCLFTMYVMAILISNVLTIYPYKHLPRNKYPVGPISVIYIVQLATTLILGLVFYSLARISETKAAASNSTILKIFLRISCISCIVSFFSWFFFMAAVASYNIDWIEYSGACVIFFVIVVAHYIIRKMVYNNGDAPHYKDKTKNILLSDVGVLAPLMFFLAALIHHRVSWIRYLVVGVITIIMFACNFFDYRMLTKRKYACNMEATHPEDNGNINHC